MSEKLQHFLFVLFATVIALVLFISYYSLYLSELKKRNEKIVITVNPLLEGYAAELKNFIPASSLLLTLHFEIELANQGSQRVALVDCDVTSTISGAEISYQELRQGLFDRKGYEVFFPVVIAGGRQRKFVLQSAVVLPVRGQLSAVMETHSREESRKDIAEIVKVLSGDGAYGIDMRQDFVLTCTTGRGNRFSHPFSVDSLLFGQTGANGP